MVLMVLVFSVATGALFAGMKIEHKDLAALDQLLRLDRLAHLWRDDVHAAGQAELKRQGGGPTALVLSLESGKTVSYLAEPDGLVRIEQWAEGVTKQWLPVGEDCRAEFAIDRSGTPVVTLRIMKRREGSGNINPELPVAELQAAVGISRR